MSESIAGIDIPDTSLVRAITAHIRDAEDDLLFNHSRRVFIFGALQGRRRGLQPDLELLYAGAMFHDMGLTKKHSSKVERFEVDGANAARDFLRSHGIAERDVETVWTAIALHTTPGIPLHMHPVIALVTAGVEMDVLGFAYEDFTAEQREAVVTAHPRGPSFKHNIIDAFYQGMRHRPDSTFGTVNDDVLAYKEPHFTRTDFCRVILGSAWAA